MEQFQSLKKLEEWFKALNAAEKKLHGKEFNRHKQLLKQNAEDKSPKKKVRQNWNSYLSELDDFYEWMRNTKILNWQAISTNYYDQDLKVVRSGWLVYAEEIVLELGQEKYDGELIDLASESGMKLENMWVGHMNLPVVVKIHGRKQY